MKDLQLNTLIIHEVEKEPGSGEAQLFLTTASVVPDERAAALIGKLNRTLEQKEDLLYGGFADGGEAMLPAAFADLVSAEFGEEALLVFSRETMQTLQLGLQGITGAKGGYVVYADYLFLERRFVGIFLVRDTEGVVFHKDPQRQAFALDATTYLHTEKLAMACRIEVDKFLRGQGRYIEVIKHAKSQKEISDYFLHWIGVERPESSREVTATFLQVVEELPRPLEVESGETMKEDRFRQEVVNFAMNSPQKTINIQAFDEHFYGSETPTRQYLEQNEVAVGDEFRFDRGALRQLNHVRLSDGDIQLSFSRGDLAAGAVRVEGNVVVIESEELALRLRELAGMREA